MLRQLAQMGRSKKPSHQQIAPGLFLLWLVLLVPWLFFAGLAGLAGMAFDGRPTLGAYLFVCSIWTYPISVIFVRMYRDDRPEVALLPILNIATLLVAGLF
jgi:hypothetical protein